ncbi:unnamed protein product [Macrosiphum euphorbiae]|uniref:Uncharacterized protein n=1 Tax=Macrosiphum euphorbiae TaxID=13131 RepID=A0AAV0W8B8_9HEMI|nr:unnamed protein product [Macrosiphum euphorbiae]
MGNSKEISKIDRSTFNSIRRPRGKTKRHWEKGSHQSFFFMPLLYNCCSFLRRRKTPKRATSGGRENKGKRAETPPPHISYQRLAIFFITATFCQKFPGKRERMETNEIRKKKMLLKTTL